MQCWQWRQITSASGPWGSRFDLILYPRYHILIIDRRIASIAAQIISYSQTDVEAEAQILEPQPTSYEPPTGDGFWTYSAEPERALFPYWESARTFVISPDQTTTIPLRAYSKDPSSSYYQEMIEVYEANNQAHTNDDEQLWIAEFWSDYVEGLMFSPPAHLLCIAHQLIEDRGLNL